MKEDGEIVLRPGESEVVELFSDGKSGMPADGVIRYLLDVIIPRHMKEYREYLNVLANRKIVMAQFIKYNREWIKNNLKANARAAVYKKLDALPSEVSYEEPQGYYLAKHYDHYVGYKHYRRTLSQALRIRERWDSRWDLYNEVGKEAVSRSGRKRNYHTIEDIPEPVLTKTGRPRKPQWKGFGWSDKIGNEPGNRVKWTPKMKYYFIYRKRVDNATMMKIGEEMGLSHTQIAGAMTNLRRKDGDWGLFEDKLYDTMKYPRMSNQKIDASFLPSPDPHEPLYPPDENPKTDTSEDEPAAPMTLFERIEKIVGVDNIFGLKAGEYVVKAVYYAESDQCGKTIVLQSTNNETLDVEVGKKIKVIGYHPEE